VRRAGVNPKSSTREDIMARCVRCTKDTWVIGVENTQETHLERWKEGGAGQGRVKWRRGSPANMWGWLHTQLATKDCAIAGERTRKKRT